MVAGCGSAEYAHKLLLLEHMDHLANVAGKSVSEVAEATAKSIANIKLEKVVVWDSGNNTTSNFIKSIANVLPPAANVFKEVSGLNLPSILSGLVADSNHPPQTSLPPPPPAPITISTHETSPHEETPEVKEKKEKAHE